MANYTLTTQTFPNGTSVGAYPATRWREDQLPPSGTPIGAATASATATGSSVAFTGLTTGVDYFASADVSGTYRYVRFSVGADVDDPDARMLAAMPFRNQRPTGVLAETVPRVLCAGSGAALTVGTFYAWRLADRLRAGQPITTIGFVAGATGLTAGATPHWWFSLLDSSLTVLRSTADQLGAAWAANAEKAVALSSPYTPGVDMDAYVGACFAVTTAPILRGFAGATQITSIAPELAVLLGAGMTTPPADGTSQTITNVYGTHAWAYLK